MLLLHFCSQKAGQESRSHKASFWDQISLTQEGTHLQFSCPPPSPSPYSGGGRELAGVTLDHLFPGGLFLPLQESLNCPWQSHLMETSSHWPFLPPDLRSIWHFHLIYLGNLFKSAHVIYFILIYLSIHILLNFWTGNIHMVRNSSSMKKYIKKVKILGHLCSGPTAATAKYETICINCLCIFSGFLYAQKANFLPLSCLSRKENTTNLDLHFSLYLSWQTFHINTETFLILSDCRIVSYWLQAP